MQITAFNGSPRGANSNSQVIVDAFLKGAQNEGATVETVMLIDKQIKHCTGCFSCWFRTPGQCVHQDDMKELLERYLSSDVVVFATPVYLWNMTACLKNFLDRLIPIKRPQVVEQGGRYDMADDIIKLPQVVIVANAGFPGESNFETLHEVMKSGNPILEIYRNSGMLLRMNHPKAQEAVNTYLNYVSLAGQSIARGEALSTDVREGLNMPLMTTEDYIAAISGK